MGVSDERDSLVVIKKREPSGRGAGPLRGCARGAAGASLGKKVQWCLARKKQRPPRTIP